MRIVQILALMFVRLWLERGRGLIIIPSFQSRHKHSPPPSEYLHKRARLFLGRRTGKVFGELHRQRDVVWHLPSCLQSRQDDHGKRRPHRLTVPSAVAVFRC